jgi:ribosome recycling factor
MIGDQWYNIRMQGPLTIIIIVYDLMVQIHVIERDIIRGSHNFEPTKQSNRIKPNSHTKDTGNNQNRKLNRVNFKGNS